MIMITMYQSVRPLAFGTLAPFMRSDCGVIVLRQGYHLWLHQYDDVGQAFSHAKGMTTASQLLRSIGVRMSFLLAPTEPFIHLGRTKT